MHKRGHENGGDREGEGGGGGGKEAGRTGRGHEDVDGLEDVEEHLELAVLDALAPPPDLPGDLARDLHLLLLRLRVSAARVTHLDQGTSIMGRDHQLEDIRVGALRVPKVENF